MCSERSSNRAERSELQSTIRDAENAARDEVWAGYRFVALADAKADSGLKIIDLGAGHSSANETLCGRVVTALKTEALLSETVGAGYLDRHWPPAFKETGAWPLTSLRQSFLNGSLTRLIDPDAALRRKIVEFVASGSFGLASGATADGRYERLWYAEPVGAEEVAFEPSVFLLTKGRSETLRTPAAPQPEPDTDATSTTTPDPDAGTGHETDLESHTPRNPDSVARVGNGAAGIVEPPRHKGYPEASVRRRTHGGCGIPSRDRGTHGRIRGGGPSASACRTRSRRTDKSRTPATETLTLSPKLTVASRCVNRLSASCATSAARFAYPMLGTPSTNAKEYPRRRQKGGFQLCSKGGVAALG